MGESERTEDSLRSRLMAEDAYMLRLIDTVPPKYYFDADTVEALTEQINSKVANRVQGSGVKKAHKMARLDPGLFQTVSQLLQASEPKTKKRRKAKASLHSAALDRASSLDELRQRLSHKIEALRGKRPAAGERKANKKAAKPASKPTQNKRHKPNQESSPAVSSKKAAKSPQAVPVFNRDSHIVYSKFELADSTAGANTRPKVEKKKKLVRQLELKAEKMKNLEEHDPERAKEAQEKQKWHRALDRAEGIKVKDDPVLLKASLKRHEKRRQQSRKKWESRTEHVKQRQEERQQKRRDNIKARKQAKLQTKMKRLKKKGHIVPGF
ncbi:hypothetical protein HPB50_027326 [Hyalomma asiaticum]|uniref:Uncharacterized protein n=1 Tax=Hyalomma asiaticum TaxID=266040 RepID=A0ACB7S6M8_HYAAI|nr:hypothetical protein HPB50_027326 [Hyalomma asiaticum]